jgi:aminopeptidase N
VMLLTMLLSCSGNNREEPDVGVPIELARQRAARISDLIYSLTFRIPESAGEPLGGSLVLSFSLSQASQPLILDFRAPTANLEAVTSGGIPVSFEFKRGQIILPVKVLKEGRNTFEFTFKPTDVALNRRREYMYTLFVPDRAATAFPCFDQPDLKARYRLVLDLPEGWLALANGSPAGSLQVGEHRVARFRETEPLSTYQFAFAAGRFQVVERKIGDRTLRMFHRETDRAKLARNVDAIFDLHALALKRMEEYTGIPLPFQKFDFILLPAFQFGGMEHPGAIYYRDSHLLLEPTATRSDELRRASLIAHETSHMWFGNLVTMRWFDDVWMKEVFANFMAAKIVNPAYPEIDHELRFLLAHQPTAYDVDRSLGTHPIRQKLDNLDHAASLYGPIIYEKAPVVMRQLEVLLGPETLQQGLRRYLDRFRYSNAGWDDLIGILDELSPEDLRAWSHAWVEEAGRPVVTIEATGHTQSGTSFEVHQSDPLGRDLRWSEELHVTAGGADGIRRGTVHLRGPAAAFDLAGLNRPSFILPSDDGLGYGFFRLDEPSRRVLLSGIPGDLPPAARAAVWLSLWDGVLAGDIEPRAFTDAALDALAHEPDELLQEHLLGRIVTAVWATGLWQDAELVKKAEGLLWKRVEAPGRAASKLASLRAFASLVRSESGVERLYRLWKGETPVEGLELGETDATRLALEVALRKEGEQASSVLDEQLARLQNPDRRDEFEFVSAAVAPSGDEREALFEQITAGLGTVRENWALESLHYLTHPLRGRETGPRILAALRLLPQVESNGSIFFPKRWLDALLWGQSSPEAGKLVEEYLRTSPELPLRLRRKVLQSADVLLRITGLRDSIRRPGRPG